MADVTQDERIVDPQVPEEEREFDAALRPRRIDEFVGQDRVKEQLALLIDGARARGETVDHLLFSGPPGLGKTTLAGIVANELGVGFQPTSGPALDRPGDLAAILTNLEEGDVLFVDEVHRMPRAVEEVLYPALEDFKLDVVIGKGPSARSIRLDLPRFTLVGATTRPGRITLPLRERFGFSPRLDYYSIDDLGAIVRRSAGILGVAIDAEGAHEIAASLARHPAGREPAAAAGPRLRRGPPRRRRHLGRGQGRPRAVRGGRGGPGQARPRDPVHAWSSSSAAGRWGSRRCPRPWGRRPTRSRTSYEPYLLQLGFLQRTPRGRVATVRAYRHLGVSPEGVLPLT